MSVGLSRRRTGLSAGGSFQTGRVIPQTEAADEGVGVGLGPAPGGSFFISSRCLPRAPRHLAEGIRVGAGCATCVPSQMGPVPAPGMQSGIRWLPSDCRRTPNLSRTSRRQSFHRVSERSPVFPIPLAHLRDVVQATRFRDEIELDAGWCRCRFQHLEKPRKPPRTDTQAHSVFSCPLLDVPHSRLLGFLGPHPAPEAARLEAGGRGQQSQGVNELICAARRRRECNS